MMQVDTDAGGEMDELAEPKRELLDKRKNLLVYKLKDNLLKNIRSANEILSVGFQTR